MVKTVRELLQAETKILHPSQAETASGQSEVIEVAHLKAELAARQGCAVLDVIAVSGTTPTLDVSIVNVDPVSGKEDTLIAFGQKTVVSTEWKYTFETGKNLGNNIRAKWTIGGTTPSFTFTLTFHLKP